MKQVNINELKAKLSEYVDLVQQGEVVTVFRRNEPVAELRGVAAKRRSERPLGGTALEVPSPFFEALPAEVEEAFHPAAPAASGAMTAFERPPRDETAASNKPRKR